MTEAADPHAAPVSDRRARSARDRGGDRCELLHPLRGRRASPSALDLLIRYPARLRGLCGRRLFPVRPARGEVAVHLAARPDATSCAPRRCWRSRCWCSTTCWSRRTSTARSSSARSPSRSTGSCRSCSSPARASPTAISATRARSSMRGEGNAVPTLILGRAADAEVLLRAIESGAVSKIRPVGILSPSRADRGQSIRGVPVLGELRRSRAGGRATARRAARTSRGWSSRRRRLRPKRRPKRS